MEKECFGRKDWRFQEANCLGRRGVRSLGCGGVGVDFCCRGLPGREDSWYSEGLCPSHLFVKMSPLLKMDRSIPTVSGIIILTNSEHMTAVI